MRTQPMPPIPPIHPNTPQYHQYNQHHQYPQYLQSKQYSQSPPNTSNTLHISLCVNVDQHALELTLARVRGAILSHGVGHAFRKAVVRQCVAACRYQGHGENSAMVPCTYLEYWCFTFPLEDVRTAKEHVLTGSSIFLRGPQTMNFSRHVIRIGLRS